MEMLKRYNEAREEALTGSPGDGTHVPLMPSTWNRSYRHLEECLKLMRDVRPKQYRHIEERFALGKEDLNNRKRTIDVSVKKGRVRLPPHCELVAGAPTSGQAKAKVRVRIWAPWVKEQEVRKGVTWISSTFRGEPYLPAEFVEAA